VKSLKFHLASKVSLGNHDAYEARAKPAFTKATGTEPETYVEIPQGNERGPLFQLLERDAAQQPRDDVEIGADPDRAPVARSDRGGGQVRHGCRHASAEPGTEIPKYHRGVDIHCMPGGYHTEFTADDVANGAVYDTAVDI